MRPMQLPMPHFAILAGRLQIQAVACLLLLYLGNCPNASLQVPAYSTSQMVTIANAFTGAALENY